MQRVGATDLVRMPTHGGDMERAIAISRDTVASTGIYASVVTTPPGGATKRHHHGDCETAIYILEGAAQFSGTHGTFDAGVGDFVYIPAGEVHVEANASTTEDLVVLVCRNCPDAVTIYVDE